MFKKKVKTCKKCGEQIESKFSFCPYCGLNNADKKNDFWNDGFIDEFDFDSLFSKFPFGNLMQEIEKQLKEIDKSMKVEEKKPVESGISISISSSNLGKPVIRVKNLGKGNAIPIQIRSVQEQPKIEKKQFIDEKEIERMSKLPRKEAETKVRRMTNRIIYEIELPGVDSLKNVSISKLENSIEIKAFSKDKAYFKLIPVSLPILRYGLKEGKLILELKPQD